MKKVLFFSIIGLLVWLVSAMSAYAQAPKAIEWRISTPHVEGRAEWIMEKEWADTIAKESGGRLKPILYPGNSLGFKDADMLRVCGGNVIEGFMFYPGYLQRDAPLITLTSPEMILFDRAHFVAYAPFAYEMMKKEYAKRKVRLSSYFASPACVVGISAKEPFNTLAGIKGKKIRAWEAPQSETFRRLGIPTQIMAQADLYLALKSGVVDGALFATTAVMTFSLYEVAKYWADLYQGAMVLGLATSDAAFNALPPDLQNLVKKVETDLIKKWQAEAVSWVKYDEEAMDAFKKKGGIVLAPFPRADQDLLVKTGIEVWRDRAKEVGPEAIDYQQKLEAELMRVKSK